jgi:dTDP-4-amino-4,6-dideoxygalactose transaminase
MGRNIKMVDLHREYQGIKREVDLAMQDVIDSSAFINGKAVDRFATNLASYNGVNLPS